MHSRPVLIMFLACGFTLAHGATFTWNGNGGNDNWSTGSNWGGSPPANNGTASTLFDGNTRLTPVIDSSWSILEMDFAAGADTFTITGSQLTLGSGGITNASAATQTVNAPLVVGSSQSWGGDTGTLVIGSTLSVADTITLGSHTLTLGGAGNISLHGVISGNGSLIKSGAGTLTISPSQSFSGGFSISGGVVEIGGNPAALGSGTVTLNGGTIRTNGTSNLNQNYTLGAGAGTFDSGSGTPFISDKITGIGQLIKTGAGGLRLSHTGNDYSGGTLVSAGRLAGSSTTLKGTVVNNAEVELSDTGANNGTYSGAMTGTGALFKTGAGQFALSGSVDIAGALNVQAGTLALGSAVSVSGGLLDVASGATLSIGDSNGVATATGLAGSGSIYLTGTTSRLVIHNAADHSSATSINGSGSLTKQGAGTQTLSSGVNSWTGGTTVSAGKLVILNSALPKGNVANEGIIEYQGSGLFTGSMTGGGELRKTGANNLTLGYDMTFSGQSGTVDQDVVSLESGSLSVMRGNVNAGTLHVAAGTNLYLTSSVFETTNITAGNLTGSGTIQLATGTGNLSATDGLLTLNNAGAVTVAHAISGSSGTFRKQGAGSVTFSGNNNTLRLISLEGGVANFSVAQSFPEWVKLSGGVEVTFGQDNMTPATRFDLMGNATIDTEDQTFTMEEVYGNTGTLTKNGTGTLVLSDGSLNATVVIEEGTIQTTGDSLYSSITNHGTLHLDDAGNVGGVGGTGTLLKTGAGEFVTHSITQPVVTINEGTLRVSGGWNQFTPGLLNLPSGSVLTIGTTSTATLTNFDATGTITLTRADTPSDDATLVVNPPANAAQTFTLAGMGGILRKQGNTAFALSGNNSGLRLVYAEAGTLTFSSASNLGTGSMYLSNGATLQAAADGMALDNNISFSGISTIDTQAHTLSLNGSTTGDFTDGFIKTGSGTLILDEVNWNGLTTVSAGTLRLTGTGPTYQITNNATLELYGNGSLSASVVGTGTVIKNGAGSYAASKLNEPVLTINEGSLRVGGSISMNTVMTSLHVESGAFFRIAGEDDTITAPNVTGSGTIVINDNNSESGGAFILDHDDDVELAVSFTSAQGKFRKQGSGLLTLGGTGSTARMSFEAGTTQFSSASVLGDFTLSNGAVVRPGADGITLSEIITINGAGTIDTQGHTLTLEGSLTGGFSDVLTKTGSGVLSVGNMNWNGQTTVSAGTLRIHGSGPSAPMINNAIVEFTGTSGAYSYGMSGTGTLKAMGTFLSLSGNNSGLAQMQLLSGSTSFSSNNTLPPSVSISNGATLSAAAETLTSGSAITLTGTATIHTPMNHLLTFSQALSGTGSLNKTGFGTLTLAGTAYSGNTTVTAGTLKLTSAGLHDLADVDVGSVLMLDFTGTDTVSRLAIGGTPCALGTWGAPGNAEADYTSGQITGTGLLLVTYGPDGPTFDRWIADYFPEGPQRDFDADPDGDGIKNGIEFVIGSIPNNTESAAVSRSRLPIATTDSTHLQIVYPRKKRALSLNPRIEHGINLLNWNVAIHDFDGVTISETPIDPDTDTITVRIPRGTAERRFARLAVDDPS